MTRIIGISGSLRRGSFNAQLLREAQRLMPESAQLQIESIAEFPLYNFDDEQADGIPAPVAQLKDAIAESDGLLISTPEYNNSIPGVTKNAIDWLSRPPDDIARVFGDLPVAIMGASPGRYGTILSQNAWLPVLRTLGANLWTGGRLQVAGAGNIFDENGRLVDLSLEERLQKFLRGFAAFVAE
jgi:chromate reductase, NAD(P)H dehydrogenase (quinone)